LYFGLWMYFIYWLTSGYVIKGQLSGLSPLNLVCIVCCLGFLFLVLCYYCAACREAAQSDKKY
jgi:hypothetical protein